MRIVAHCPDAGADVRLRRRQSAAVATAAAAAAATDFIGNQSAVLRLVKQRRQTTATVRRSGTAKACHSDGFRHQNLVNSVPAVMEISTKTGQLVYEVSA